MNPVTLKIHIQSLAAESRYIRREIVRQTRVFREFLIRDRLIEGGLSPKQIERIVRRAKGRHLRPAYCGFSKINWEPSNPQPTAFDGTWLYERKYTMDVLRFRRREVLRKEARIAHLAYAFFRGVSYSTAEAFVMPPSGQVSYGRLTSPAPNWQEVLALAQRFDSGDDPRIVKQQFASWMDEALAYRRQNNLSDLQPRALRDQEKANAAK